MLKVVFGHIKKTKHVKIGNENLQQTLRQVSDEYSSSAQKAPLLLHAWLIKQSG